MKDAYKPDLALPFVIDRKEAIEIIRKNFAKKMFIPKDFCSTSSLESLQGRYVPFWMYDMETHVHFEGEGRKIRTWTEGDYDCTETSIYRLIRDFDVNYDKIPVDASKNMPDEKMDLVEPYKYTALGKFRSRYLSGFQAEIYDENKEEPETMEAAVDNYQIPLILGYYKERWVYGQEAKRLREAGEGDIVTHLFRKAVKRKKVRVGGKIHDGVWLLAKFISMTLKKFEQIDYITFSVPYTNVDMSKMLKGIGKYIGVPGECVFVQDYKESFCQYMFYQPKELWQYESALFYCDAQEIRAYMLRRLNTVSTKSRDMFVTVEEVANAHMKELEAIYPVLNVDKAKDADESFKSFIQNVFDKKVVSSVYLTGEGFENNWYPNSLKVLCNGRRAFLGNNLYSKGACYSSMRYADPYDDGPIYLDGTKMTEQICLRMRIGGQEGWYPIVAWGTHWYEADGQWEVILEDTSDIEIHIETLDGEDLKVETVSLEELPERTDYSLRLQIEVMFMDERTCRLRFKDVGFGEFYPASDFLVEKELHLGGINGQFNSLS